MPTKILAPTLAPTLARHLGAQPDALLYRFLPDGDPDAAVAWTYADTFAHAAAVATALRDAGLVGRRVLLVHPPGLSYVAAFLGSLLAGAVPVPAYPPVRTRLARTLPRLLAIAGAAGIDAVLVDADGEAEARALVGGTPLAEVPWLCTDALPLPARPDPGWLRAPARPDDVAYLQFTSGSTADPRGVMVTHANLAHNARVIGERFGTGTHTRGFSWLPPYHDMGLVGGLLQPLFAGGHTTLMAPEAFLKRPLRWLEAVSRFGVTTTGGPDFAYALCARRGPRGAALDLSSWTLAYSGAEPVRAATLARFAEVFGPHGFDRRAFYPCYGLAESTLYATGGRHGAGADALAVSRIALAEGRAEPADDDTVSLVSVGAPADEHRALVVSPETRRVLPDGQVGEIWLQGPSVTAGYWGRPEVSRALFGAQLADAPDAGAFLRTGDLGFLRDGALYVSGRRKDLIVVRGLNHYPQDLEQSLADVHRAVREAVAFPTAGEGAAVAVEVRGEPEPLEVVQAVRRAVADAHELALDEVYLLPPRTLPKTSSGKPMRAALRDGLADGSVEARFVWRKAAATDVSAGDLREWLIAQVAALAGTAPGDVDPARPLVEAGLDSTAGVALAGEVEQRLGRPVPASLVWDHPSIDAIARHLAGEAAAAPVAVAPSDEPIAIVGLACRFPGDVDGPDALWRLLDGGLDAVTPGAPARGILRDADAFDADFFATSPREAESLDPRQRMLLEVAWEALERAGLATDALAGSATGVFVGLCGNDFQQQLLDAGPVDERYALTGNLASVAAGRLSYALGLTGPALAVDTACSSSLVAVHLACQSLRSGECTAALAGGANLVLSPVPTACFEAMHAMSPSGRCAPFDAGADGYVRSDGCAVVVLKRLSDARRDGDPIVAVLRGSAVNHDGRSNGLTAPSGPSQEAVIRAALQRAGLAPGDVSYVEAHGTGTPLGDPIEARALGAVYGPVRVGAVKSNLGHTEAAAGIAGLVKAALALHHERIPATLHFRAPSAHVDWAGLGLQVVAEPVPWPRGDVPRRAGVSAFGFAGTNAHVILEEAPPATPRTAGAGPWLFPLSAPTDAALAATGRRLAAHLREHPEVALSDVAFTLATARRAFGRRAAVVADGPDALCAALERLEARAVRPGKLGLLFGGQGSQRAGMGRALAARFPLVADVLARCERVAAEAGLPRPLRDVMWAEPDSDDGRLLHHTAYTQPAVVALGCAVAAQLRALGVAPDVVCGHSVGEIAAAVAAGALDLDDAVRWAVARGGRSARCRAGPCSRSTPPRPRCRASTGCGSPP
ncbi:MAG: AMP-binding protein [Myxococcota bacterium]